MTYRLYVDEVGNDDLGHAADERHRFLSLTGIAIDQAHNRDVLVPALHTFKAEIFQHDADTPLVLHRKEIMQKKGAFGVLNDAALCARFDDGLIRIMTETEYAAITVVIDKREMLRQEHWNESHPYHYLMQVLVEKYAQWLERKNDIGDIMPESRQGKDAALQKAFDRVRRYGTNYVSAPRIQARLPAKQLKFREKKHDIPGLQLCDMIAHPSQIDVRKRRGHQVTLGAYASRVVPILLDARYDRSPFGRINGYGTKFLP